MIRRMPEHWDGVAWHEISDLPIGYELISVSARSTNDVWAAGSYDKSGTQQGFILHWNGSDWTQADTPDLPGTVFGGVVAISDSDAWAVGRRSHAPDRRVMEHWDGHEWTIVNHLE